MEIVAGEAACYRLLAFISLNMELHWSQIRLGVCATTSPLKISHKLFDTTLFIVLYCIKERRESLIKKDSDGDTFLLLAFSFSLT
jgi:hypothetical protein